MELPGEIDDEVGGNAVVRHPLEDFVDCATRKETRS